MILTMKHLSRRLAAAASALAVSLTSMSVPQRIADVITADAAGSGTNVVEYLNRGISAVNTGNGMLVNWRWLADDASDATFKLYRDGTLIYTSTTTGATCYLDTGGSASSKYRVDTYAGTALKSSEECKLISDQTYFDIPVTPPSSIYSPNDCSVGDVDGDGQYEIFMKWDPNNSKDNSQKGTTGNVFIDCYRLDGTRLWRIDLGKNIRAGAHYTQFYVADFDLDGKCEMTCKTSDGTVDGKGTVIGDASADYRNSSGYILTGNEYYTLFDGATGAALDTVNYPVARGTVSNWGDKYGNRVDRFWGTVAYLDGVHPCVVTGRGYYTRLTAAAYAVENKKLKHLWTYDSGNTNSSTNAYGDGNHNSMPVDVDGDGKQEVFTGAAIIDDNGSLYYTTNTGHGDAMHVGDLDPTNPGQEAWICHEDKASGYGVSLIDLDQKKVLYHQNGAGDTGRCCADNVWTGNPGAECWGNKTSDNTTPVVSTNGTVLSCNRPAINFLSYWDGDLEREILDGYTDSPATISKMNENGKLSTILTTTGFYTCNTTKGTPCLSADIFGDWREELIVRAADSKSIRIYATPYATDYRVTTLMHDPQYRMQVSSQNTAYNQPPHTSFFLGTGYDMPARPEVVVNGGGAASTLKTGTALNTNNKYVIKNVNSGLFLSVDDRSAAAGANVSQSGDMQTWTLKPSADNDGYYYILSELGDGKTYYLDVDYGKTDNGTNIGIYTDTASDAQLYKFVSNGDGTFTIVTKVSFDASGIGITAGSKDIGANAIEWECDGTDNQKWILGIQGGLVQDLDVNDITYFNGWATSDSAAVGDLVWGDRDGVTVLSSGKTGALITISTLPSELVGAEQLLTACDAKFAEGDLAAFTAAKDATVYVALDTRVETVPSWMSGYTRLSEQMTTSNDVTFDIYSLSVKEGERVTLGNNGQNSYCMNYTVFLKEAEQAPATTTTTAVTTTTTETTTTTTAEETTTTTEAPTTSAADKIYGDANGDGTVSVADPTLIMQVAANPNGFSIKDEDKPYADVSGSGDGVTSADALTIQKFLAGSVPKLPE